MERILFRIFVIFFSFDCTISQPSRNAVKNETESSVTKKNLIDAMLAEIGYETQPETVGEWRAVFLCLIHKCETLKNELERSKKEKKDLYYQILLGLREEVKYLENFLYPRTMMGDPNNRYLRWTLIFAMLRDHPIVKALKERIIAAGFTLDEFARMMQTFYGEDLSLIHGVRLPDMPVEEMVKILTQNSRKTRYKEVRFMEIILESDNIIKNVTESVGLPIEDPDNFAMTTVEPRCLKLGKVSLSSSEYNETIRAFFKIKDRKIVNVTHMDKIWGQGQYRIEFSSPMDAINGLTHHVPAITDKHVSLFLVDCITNEELLRDRETAKIIDFD